MKKLFTCILTFCQLLAQPLFAQPQSLDREAAAKIVAEFYDYPNVLFEDWKFAGFGNPYQDLISQGYVFLDKSDQFNWKYTFTESGRKYVIASPSFVALGIRNFNEISGIKTISDYSKMIDFSCRVTDLTPFGKWKGLPEIINYSVKVEKYDDGWRITEKKDPNFKPSNYSIFSGANNRIQKENNASAEQAYTENRVREEQNALEEEEKQAQAKYKKLVEVPFDYSKILQFKYNYANLGNPANVKFTFSNGCLKCDTKDVGIFLSELYNKVGQTPRNPQKVEGEVPSVAFNFKISAMDYPTMVYPELEVIVDYELMNAKGIKVNTLTKKYKASQIEGKATKELLLIRIIDNLERNINREFYNIIPIETNIVRIGVPNKKGEVDEVIINTPPELSEFSYDAFVLSERDVTVVDGVAKISKILAKGKIKSRDIKPEGTKIRLKDNSKEIKEIFERGEKLFAIIAIDL